MSKLYLAIINTVEKFVPANLKPLWEHPAGPKHIHFWAPLGKWGLVLAGIGDINRPPELISIRQVAALAATGLIWARFSVTIIPVNYSLMTVNIFVALTAGYQAARAIKYHMEHPEISGDTAKKKK